MTYRRAAAIVAAFVLLVGVVLLLVPVRVSDARVGEVLCGSAAFPDQSGPDAGATPTEVEMFTVFRSECNDGLSARQTAGYSVVGAAALALLFIGLTALPKRQPPVQPSIAPEGAEQQS